MWASEITPPTAPSSKLACGVESDNADPSEAAPPMIAVASSNSLEMVGSPDVCALASAAKVDEMEAAPLICPSTLMTSAKVDCTVSARGLAREAAVAGCEDGKASDAKVPDK